MKLFSIQKIFQILENAHREKQNKKNLTMKLNTK